MSRKWERMIEKNRSNVNKHREKGGKAKLSYGGQSEMERFRGRSFILPIVLISISIFFLLFYGQTEEQDSLFWITVFGYLFLGLYFFFLKRPYLKIGKAQISTRKFGREKFVQASEIEKITIQPGYIIISVKGKRTHLIFSRLFNRYDTTAMAARLKEFAHRHTIPYVIENK